MKTEIENQYTWDDVIFENRNRSYGAYLVRQTYSRNATIAFGASVSFAILLIFSPQIINYLSGGKIEIPTIVACDEKGMIFIAPPPDLPLPPPPVQQVTPPPATASAPVANLTPEVVTHESSDEIPPNNELLANTSTVEGNGPYIESPTTGTTPEVVVALPSGPLDIAEVMPEYDGGQQAMIKFISKNIRYPRSASTVGTEGTVYVSFVINADGDVVDVKVVRGVSADCDKEAMRVISKMTEWNAGMMHQIPVAVRMVLPIRFQINH